MEPPIRIKLYGLFSVTRRGYIAQLVIAGVLLVGWVGMWLYLRRATNPADDPAVARIRQVFDWIPWLALAVAILYVIEAYFVFRRFAREQARRRAEQPPKP
jgi:hypothetical protein